MKKEDEILAQWAEDHLKNLPLESPSTNFSDAIMNKIQAEQAVKSPYFMYRPLISKPVWAAICVGVIATVYLIYMGRETESLTRVPLWMETASRWIENMHIHLPSFTLSQTTGMALLIFSIMALVEISILQNLFRQKTK